MDRLSMALSGQIMPLVMLVATASASNVACPPMMAIAAASARLPPEVHIPPWVNASTMHPSVVAQDGQSVGRLTASTTSTNATFVWTMETPAQYLSLSTTLVTMAAQTTTTIVKMSEQAGTVGTTPVTSSTGVANSVTARTSRSVSMSVPAPVSGSEVRSDSNILATSTNSCEGSLAACLGDITHYDGGLGACGWNVDTTLDMQIALPEEFMGQQSNGNPYCGRSLTIQNPTTGQTVSATVGDKCQGCSGRSIDLTDVLFKTIGAECDGRCSGFKWWFN